MNTVNYTEPTLTAKDKEIVKRIQNGAKIPKSGSLGYSPHGAANYVRAVQEGKIIEVLRDMNK